jgi:glycosyltransferase involved in cell wall biosynthesis
MKTILMVAFHFPPFKGSSGVLRTLHFSKYLSENGWRPVVLTATPSAYPDIDPTSLAQIPSDVAVERAVALDAGRHLAFRGRYWRRLALPDRWISWLPAAVARGLGMVRRYRPDVVWSTYPIATAHLIGNALQRLSGLPWVADFRDPMVETDPLSGEEFPPDPTIRRLHANIERSAVRRAAAIVVTTPGAARMMAQRYGGVSGDRIRVIQNGFDEESFARVESEPRAAVSDDAPTLLLHSGLLYPAARNPDAFFQALAELRTAGEESARTLRVVFRASGHDKEFRSIASALGVDDLVAFEPPIPYERALAEMLRANGLLIFQASNCNAQIPTKLYEYLRARRPIFALTDDTGDTAGVLRSEGIESIVPLTSKERIIEGLRLFLASVRDGTAHLGLETSVARYSRRSQTVELAGVLRSVSA